MPRPTAHGAWLDKRLPELLAEYDDGMGHTEFLHTDRADRRLNR
jgi:hypothetical protein